MLLETNHAKEVDVLVLNELRLLNGRDPCETRIDRQGGQCSLQLLAKLLRAAIHVDLRLELAPGVSTAIGIGPVGHAPTLTAWARAYPDSRAPLGKCAEHARRTAPNTSSATALFRPA